MRQPNAARDGAKQRDALSEEHGDPGDDQLSDEPLDNEPLYGLATIDAGWG